MTTIRNQLKWRILILEFVLLVNTLAIGLPVTWSALTGQIDETLQAQLRSISMAVEREDDRIVFDTSDLPLPHSFAGEIPLMYQVWDLDGRELAKSPELIGDLPRPGSQPSEISQFLTSNLTNGLRVRIATQLVFPAPNGTHRSPTNHPGAFVSVAMDRSRLDGKLIGVALTLGGSMATLMLVTAIVVPWVVRTQLAPLDELASKVQQINAESLSERLPTGRLPGELAPIATRLNDLLVRLEVAFSKERQFSDDLAHEFRTPIAELRSLVEVALRWPEARDASTDREILSIAMQMEHMINNLLTIARMGGGLEPASTEIVSVNHLLEEIWRPMSERASARGLHPSFDVPADFFVSTNRVLLRSILANLLDNAVEYSTEGSAIRMAIRASETSFNLEISNLVSNLSDADVSHLFDRFWRKEPSRTGSQHSGLGLALARTISCRLGYSLTASLSDQHLLTLNLSGLNPLQSAELNSSAPVIKTMKISPVSVAIPFLFLATSLPLTPGCSTGSTQSAIPREQAQAIALTKAPGGTIKDGELEKEHGRLLWSFDIAVPGQKDITEIQVDATSGEIVSIEKESPEAEAKEKK